MKRLIVFLHIILAYFSLGCSDINHTPSAVVLKYHTALREGDILALKKSMTREAYLRLIEERIDKLEGQGKVFAYDRLHFNNDPESLRRMETKLSDYFKSFPKADIKLISEHASAENMREIYLEKNGEKEVVGLVAIDNEWKISRLPGGGGN